MDEALYYLALARKAGRAELGEEPVGAVARALKAHLIMVASDASDHTWRRGKSYVAGTKQQCVRVPFTKDEMGQVIGRQSLAIAALTDVSMALAFLQSLPDQKPYASEIQVLQEKVTHDRLRTKEAKAHQRNVRKGKVKKN